MAQNTQLSTNVLGQVKGFLAMDSVQKRFNDVLGAKSQQYMASIVNAVSGSNQLMACEPKSILAAAFVAASFDLPVDSNLGFCALVPYDQSVKDANGNWTKVKMAQFQMMYKGYIQLAIRTGEYDKMNCAEVYEDELESYNPITGECQFVKDFNQCTQRNNGATDKVVGYFAWFKLLSGYKKELFMTNDEILNHAKKYSQSFRYDLQKGKKSSRWSTDFGVMAKKTVIKLLLSKWGILSVQMQNAITDDQKVFDAEGNGTYSDNQPDIAEDPFKTLETKEDGDQQEETAETQETEAQQSQFPIGNGTPEEFAEFEAAYAQQQ